MAITSSLTISGSKTGDPVANPVIGPISQTNTDAPTSGPTTQAFTAATFAAVTFPALIGSAAIKGVIIQPPSGNTGTITLKGVTGDTGIPIHKTEATYIRFASVTASNFGILCSADTILEFIWV